MNIFVLAESPTLAARYHDDVRLPKMVVELYQQLGSAVRRHGATDEQMPLTQKGTPLKGGYHNHPCTRWVGDSLANFFWAHRHAMALCHEYTSRFGKVHSCQAGIVKLLDLSVLIPSGTLTPFAQAMPDEFRRKDGNAVEAYREYYRHGKNYMNKGKGPQWKKIPSRKPAWFEPSIRPARLYGFI